MDDIRACAAAAGASFTRSGVASRLADILFVQALRTHIAACCAETGGWLRALTDPQVGARVPGSLVDEEVRVAVRQASEHVHALRLGLGDDALGALAGDVNGLPHLGQLPTLDGPLADHPEPTVHVSQIVPSDAGRKNPHIGQVYQWKSPPNFMA